MKIIRKDLGENYKEIKLLALSDFHIGDKLCNLKKIKELLNEIKNSESYRIGNAIERIRFCRNKIPIQRFNKI